MHEQHRERLKRRFLESGLDSFDAHNVLELLLFYSVPRRDTNELAHRLINKYGSIPAVFDADFAELSAIDGVGAHTATLLKLMPQLARRYIADGSITHERYDTAAALGNFFVSKFIGETVEVVYMAFLNSSYKMLGCELLHSGSVNSSHITMRTLIERSIATHASMVVLAHNHPGGIAVPSSEDVSTTRMIHEALSLIDVRLLEHFVVAGNKYMPIMAGPLGALNQSMGEDEKKRFYQDII